MGNLNIYENIGKRTAGNIYIGIVGPVRSGKSTFIKRFMDLLVLPDIDDIYERQRLTDELPQSGSGRTITTTEPKFIPAEAVELKLDSISVKVRLVDCVGYMIPGALGHLEDGEARLVATPWSSDKLPFEQAAEIGTEKVIKEHSTVGIAITTDGTIGTIGRDSYREAEELVIRQLLDMRKPFVVVVNSTEPKGILAQKCALELTEKFGVPAVAMDCAKADEDELGELMRLLVGRFPVREVAFRIPAYLEGLEGDHWLREELAEQIKYWAHSFETVDDLIGAVETLAGGQIVQAAELKRIDMGTGEALVNIELERGLYYNVVTELMGEEVADDHKFFKLLKEFAEAKAAYDKLKYAMEQVDAYGYGIVEPDLTEMVLDEPELFKQGSKFGVKIKAKAPTLHIIKTDITTEVSPVVGSETQSADLVASLKDQMSDDAGGIWQTNIFGKTLQEMISEQMGSKLSSVPENVRGKMQKSLQKISDEGKEYFICIVI